MLTGRTGRASEGTVMLERPLVPLDGSRVAEGVIALVAFLGRRLGEPVSLVTVVPELDADGRVLNPILSADDAAAASLRAGREQYAREYLESVRARLERDGVAASGTVVTGMAAAEIIDAAARHSAGMIAMATHGRVGPERWFLGSVADRVVRTATVPVLLVRPREAGAQEAVAHIIVPLDGSAAAEAALPVAQYLAASLQVPITLVRTIDLMAVSAFGHGMPPNLLAIAQQDAEDYLARSAEQLRTAGVAVQTQFSLLAPSTEIEMLATGLTDPLVVMTPHGRSGIARTLLGSVADRVVRTSQAPVLLVPSAE